MIKGKYISLDGSEGIGKSTHVKLLARYLNETRRETVYCHEPGFTKEGEAIRAILKDTEGQGYELDSMEEAHLFNCSRHILIRKFVRPNLEKGINVISDRTADSTRAYQGYAGGEDLSILERDIAEATEGLTPDLSIFIDVDPRIGLAREIEAGRFSEKGLEYFDRVRDGFLEIARLNPRRCQVLPYIDGDIEEMQDRIRKFVEGLF